MGEKRGCYSSMASHPPKEKRKVQISGKSSCMISLPKRWVKEMGLVQGSPLTISRHNSASLLITMDRNIGGNPPQNEKLMASLYVSRPEPPETILRKIVCLYIQGYNMVRVKLNNEGSSSSSFLKTTIRELVRRQLIGVEIVSDNSEGLVLQILLGKSELTIDNGMKRMSIVTSSMLEDAVAAIRFSDRRRAHDVLEKDEIERFGSYISRQIFGSLNHDSFKDEEDAEPEKLVIYLMISRAIENVAKSARDIADHGLRLKTPLNPASTEELGRVGEIAAEIFDSSVLSFFKRDSRAAEMTIDRAKEFASTAGLLSLPDNEISVLVGVLDSMKNVVRHSIEISNLVLSLTSDQYVRIESSVQSVAGGALMMERDQLSVYSN
jgi:phosphate uptake regulator